MHSTQAACRVVLAKPGLDGHDRGARVIARALRDAGMEVIYTGLHQTPEMILSACRQEDPDVLCLSILSGAHMTIIPALLKLMEESGLSSTPVLVGGIIPQDDARELKRLGVREVLGPGTDTRTLAGLIEEMATERRAAMEDA
ncbi:cobalamin B12-binding domain-containing protein [bacterium]|nr:cobalamin B12-binding domain-containing protein [bacterium]